MNNTAIKNPKKTNSLIANIEKQFDKEVYVAKYSKMMHKPEKTKFAKDL